MSEDGKFDYSTMFVLVGIVVVFGIFLAWLGFHALSAQTDCIEAKLEGEMYVNAGEADKDYIICTYRNITTLEKYDRAVKR